MTDQSLKNKQLRQQRTTLFFLEATCAIIAEEGVAAVTIRKVADRAGYSSASIYKYFENVEQLIAFSAISCLKGFLRDLGTISPDASPVEKYLRSIYFSTYHTFRNMQMYRAVFVDRTVEPFRFFEDYYALFPEERQTLPQDLYNSFFAPEYHVRTHSLLEQCARQGYLRADDLEEIVDFTNIIFEGLISRQHVDPQRFDENYHVRMMKQVLLMYNPGLQPLIQAIRFSEG